MWMNGIRESQDVTLELERTINGVIKHNIGILYFYFNANMD